VAIPARNYSFTRLHLRPELDDNGGTRAGFRYYDGPAFVECVAEQPPPLFPLRQLWVVPLKRQARESAVRYGVGELRAAFRRRGLRAELEVYERVAVAVGQEPIRHLAAVRELVVGDVERVRAVAPEVWAVQVEA